MLSPINCKTVKKWISYNKRYGYLGMDLKPNKLTSVDVLLLKR